VKVFAEDGDDPTRCGLKRMNSNNFL
jgi:hypothetical protein